MNGEHFASMLWEAYRSFDCVIIDSSPLGMVSDALNFARYVDTVALVVRAGHTQTPEAQKTIVIGEDGLITIAGGKLTGYRKMAEEVLARVGKVLKKDVSLEDPLGEPAGGGGRHRSVRPRWAPRRARDD